MRFLLIFFFWIIACGSSPNNWGISQPYKDPNKKSQYDFDRQMYLHFNQLQVVTTNPMGNRQGNIGDMVIYQATGNVYKFEVETTSPSGKAWQGVNLGVI